jgi:hypothetical protein
MDLVACAARFAQVAMDAGDVARAAAAVLYKSP